MANPRFFCQLTHEGLLAVRGVDASKFLQGQLTCNLNYLDAHTSSLGARCTAKGRMLSSFRILAQGDGYLLAMAAELVAGQLAELQKFAVFSKVKLSDETTGWSRYGLAQADDVLAELGLELPVTANAVARRDDLLAVRLTDGRAELWVAAGQADAILSRLQASLPETAVEDWFLAQVRAGVGQVFGATRELFIPQMLNLQALDAVSFRKGCYTGQEIVARMQYLGKLKRRLYRLALAGDTLPALAGGIFSPVHASAVGEVVLAARAADRVELLAVLQQDAVTDGRLHLQAIDGPPLQLLELPYVLDPDREILR